MVIVEKEPKGLRQRVNLIRKKSKRICPSKVIGMRESGMVRLHRLKTLRKRLHWDVAEIVNGVQNGMGNKLKDLSTCLE